MERPVQISRIPKSDFHQMVRDLDAEKKKRTLEPQLPLLKLSKYVNDRLQVDEPNGMPECVTCGVCCNFAMIAPISQVEGRRLDEFLEITLDGTDNRVPIDAVLLRNAETGSCVHLDGELGQNVGCGIYERRPSVCREFEPGSPRCHEYRRIYGLEPQLTEDQLTIAMQQIEKREPPEKIDDVVIVEDGRVHQLERTPEGMVATESIRLKIFAFLSDETPHEVHTYYASDETWYENELLGMSLDQAKALVTAKKV